jgi:hypothetical protein
MQECQPLAEHLHVEKIDGGRVTARTARFIVIRQADGCGSQAGLSEKHEEALRPSSVPKLTGGAFTWDRAMRQLRDRLPARDA